MIGIDMTMVNVVQSWHKKNIVNVTAVNASGKGGTGMKKWIIGALMLVLLLTFAAAETTVCRHTYCQFDLPVKQGWYIAEEGGLEYRVLYDAVCEHCGDKVNIYKVIPDDEVPAGGVQVCPHEVMVYDTLLDGFESWALNFAQDISGFRSASCYLCGEDYLFFDGDPTGLVCDGKRHIYQMEPDIIEEGWYRGQGGPEPLASYHHAYKTYYRAQCVSCSEILKCFVSEMYANGEMMHGTHELKEVAAYHKQGTTKHIRVYTCSLCGYTTDYEYTCSVNTVLGRCAEEMKEAWAFYGLE